MPDISVILPVYNGGEMLKQSVQSVLAQAGADFELIIVDDCSNDGSWTYLESIKDERVRASRNTVNQGLFKNLNKLAAQAGASLIKLWAQDDIMLPGCLESIIKFHRECPGLGFSYSSVQYIDQEGRQINKPAKHDATPRIISSDLHALICFYTGSIAANISNVTISRDALMQAGGFNDRMRMSGDFELYVRLARHHPVGFINQPLVALRDHNQQLSRQEKYYLQALQEDMHVYTHLKSYCSGETRRKGEHLLRNHKLIFYYTLMIRALIKGKASIARSFWKEIGKADNRLVLSYYFLLNKTIYRSRNHRRQWNNAWLMALHQSRYVG